MSKREERHRVRIFYASGDIQSGYFLGFKHNLLCFRLDSGAVQNLRPSEVTRIMTL